MGLLQTKNGVLEGGMHGVSSPLAGSPARAGQWISPVFNVRRYLAMNPRDRADPLCRRIGHRMVDIASIALKPDDA